MVSVPTFQSNPYSSFDPSQWSNPYSPFPNQAIPFPSSYVGTPTDWSGKPIASYQAPQAAPAPAAAPGAVPGMTLNSSPAGAGTGWWGGPFQAPANNAQAAAAQAAYADASRQSGNIGSIQTETNTPGMANYFLGQSVQGSQMANAAMQGGAGAGAAAPAAAPNNSAAYLSALAHPNPVVTPGATVPQSPTSYQPGSGALQQFMARFRPAASGPGAGFQQGFYNTLKGQGYG
jgi:hypothetical protein